MNVYDFDHTIYPGDSALDFCLFCYRKDPGLFRYLPRQLLSGIGYVFSTDKTRSKEKFYSFFKSVTDIDALLEEFWDKNISRIKPFYLEKRRDDDVIITASPQFIVEAAAARLGKAAVIGSLVDKRTGKYTGSNCRGEEKVRRFCAAFPDAVIDVFYSDSDSDLPLARLAEQSFSVRGKRIEPWQTTD